MNLEHLHPRDFLLEERLSFQTAYSHLQFAILSCKYCTIVSERISILHCHMSKSSQRQLQAQLPSIFAFTPSGGLSQESVVFTMIVKYIVQQRSDPIQSILSLSSSFVRARLRRPISIPMPIPRLFSFHNKRLAQSTRLARKPHIERARESKPSGIRLRYNELITRP